MIHKTTKVSILGKNILAMLVVITPILAFSDYAKANTITFGNLVNSNLGTAGVLTEDGFSYQASSGSSWELQNFFGNPPSALVTFFDSPPVLGGTVDFTRSGGGQFTFTSVDYATILSSNSDQVTLTGFLGGNQVGSLLINSSTPSNTVLTTLSSTFSGQIDLLRVEFTSEAGAAMILDNFNFGIASDPPPSVPEPSSVLALLGLGLGVLASKKQA